VQPEATCRLMYFVDQPSPCHLISESNLSPDPTWSSAAGAPVVDMVDVYRGTL